MKIAARDQNRLLITHRSIVVPMVMAALGILLAFGGLVAAIDEDQLFGWLGVLLGAALAGLGVVVILSPDRAEFDRDTGQLTVKQRPEAIPFSALSGVQVVEIVRPSTKGTPTHSNFVQVTFKDGSDPLSIHRHSVRQAKAVAARDTINDFLGLQADNTDIQVFAGVTGLLIGTRETGPNGIGPIRDVPKAGN